MNVTRYAAEDLATFLRRHRIATMPELKSRLGTNVEMTVFRKLRQLSYWTSYSHGSRYYTLEEIAEFDATGLWSCRDVWFSKYRTLLNTLESFVNSSQAGCFAGELQEYLHVGVKESLLRLVRKERIAREEVSGLYLYCSRHPTTRRRQLAARVASESQRRKQDAVWSPEGLTNEIKAAIILFQSLLDEKQRRLFAGLEALKVGRGGDQQIADLLGIHPHTVARGRQELLARDMVVERTRRAGGGRKGVKKNT